MLSIISTSSYPQFANEKIEARREKEWGAQSHTASE